MYTIHDYNLNNDDISIVNKWKTSLTDNTINRPLFICGESFIGKTTFANILLKDYRIITIDNYNINDLEKIISKRDISLMFKKKINKSVIFDNIDNSFIPYIINIITKYLNIPYIITCSNMISSKIQKLINKCHFIELNRFMMIRNRDIFIEDTIKLSNNITNNYNIHVNILQ